MLIPIRFLNYYIFIRINFLGLKKRRKKLYTIFFTSFLGRIKWRLEISWSLNIIFLVRNKFIFKGIYENETTSINGNEICIKHQFCCAIQICCCIACVYYWILYPQETYHTHIIFAFEFWYDTILCLLMLIFRIFLLYVFQYYAACILCVLGLFWKVFS